MTTLTLIVAMDRHGAIGKAGGLPWHLPADLQHFKATTMGHAIVMGRKTFASIGKALPGRQNIVITRSADWRTDGCEVAASLDQALQIASAAPLIIGGGQIYRLAMPLAERLIVTEVDTAVADADTWFPAIDPSQWWAVRAQAGPIDAPLRYSFVTYLRAPRGQAK